MDENSNYVLSVSIDDDYWTAHKGNPDHDVTSNDQQEIPYQKSGPSDPIVPYLIGKGPWNAIDPVPGHEAWAGRKQWPPDSSNSSTCGRQGSDVEDDGHTTERDEKKEEKQKTGSTNSKKKGKGHSNKDGKDGKDGKGKDSKKRDHGRKGEKPGH